MAVNSRAENKDPGITRGHRTFNIGDLTITSSQLSAPVFPNTKCSFEWIKGREYILLHVQEKKNPTKNSRGRTLFPDSFSFLQAFSYPTVSMMPAGDKLR